MIDKCHKVSFASIQPSARKAITVNVQKIPHEILTCLCNKFQLLKFNKMLPMTPVQEHDIYEFIPDSGYVYNYTLKNF